MDLLCSLQRMHSVLWPGCTMITSAIQTTRFSNRLQATRYPLPQPIAMIATLAAAAMGIVIGKKVVSYAKNLPISDEGIRISVQWLPTVVLTTSLAILFDTLCPPGMEQAQLVASQILG